jgi:hypothetical protein
MCTYVGMCACVYVFAADVIKDMYPDPPDSIYVDSDQFENGDAYIRKKSQVSCCHPYIYITIYLSICHQVIRLSDMFHLTFVVI